MILHEQKKLEHYEQVYYSFQVEGRGVHNAQDLEQRFLAICKSYDELVGPLLPTDKSIKCLDLACGYGNFLYYLMKQGFPNAIGIDLDERQVALARLIQLDVRLQDVREAFDEHNNLGLVSAFDLIEHLDKNDAVSLLQQIHRSLEDGGVLVLQCPCTDGFTGAHDMTNDLTHRWSPSSNMLSQLLRSVGFSKVQIIDLSMPPFPQTFWRKAALGVRRAVRFMLGFFFKLAGINAPRVWSNSQIAVAWKTA